MDRGDLTEISHRSIQTQRGRGRVRGLNEANERNIYKGYEKDVFVKLQKDMEKVFDVFGILVGYLQPKHQSGQVHLSHAYRFALSPLYVCQQRQEQDGS
jgi:hypothetical protein